MIKHTLFATLILWMQTPTAVAQSDSNAVFDQLKGLAGLWQRRDSNSDFRIEFSLTANDTVLVETWLSKGKQHSLTLYHRDQDRLLATHYCPQGNQPRMVLNRDADDAWIRFEYLDATNLPSLDLTHQHSLAFHINGDNKSIERAEVYRAGDKEQADSMILIRADE